VHAITNGRGVLASSGHRLDLTLAFFGAGEADATVVVVTTAGDTVRLLGVANASERTVPVVAATRHTSCLFTDAAGPTPVVITTAEDTAIVHANIAGAASVISSAAELTPVAYADLAITTHLVITTIRALAFEAELLVGTSVATPFEVTTSTDADARVRADLTRLTAVVTFAAGTTDIVHAD